MKIIFFLNILVCSKSVFEYGGYPTYSQFVGVKLSKDTTWFHKENIIGSPSPWGSSVKPWGGSPWLMRIFIYKKEELLSTLVNKGLIDIIYIKKNIKKNIKNDVEENIKIVVRPLWKRIINNQL
eukprot:GHVL01035534.1.p2 GENE.GHVL01035534.1~~GHVL01035534.1.p2  ORF type:complete len:124 (-),score=36.69 GHVL01035534.1:10-381(-)